MSLRKIKLPPGSDDKSMGQIERALVGIAVVLSAVFMPMAFMSGATGDLPPVSITLISSMLLSVFCGRSLTPALCATILKAAPEGGHKPNALFARFNTLFEKSTQHYTDSTRSLLRCTGRYMVVKPADLRRDGGAVPGVHRPLSSLLRKRIR